MSLFRNTVVLASRGVRMMQARTYADGAMKLTFAAANKVFYDQAEVKQVDVPSFSGDFGILAAHVPTLGECRFLLMQDIGKYYRLIKTSFEHFAAVLKPGVVTVYENDGSTKKVFVSSGTVTVNEDSSVQVLAEEAHAVEDLDARAAQDTLSAAQTRLASAKDDKERSEAIIAVEVAELIVAAAK